MVSKTSLRISELLCTFTFHAQIKTRFINLEPDRTQIKTAQRTLGKIHSVASRTESVLLSCVRCGVRLQPHWFNRANRAKRASLVLSHCRPSGTQATQRPREGGGSLATREGDSCRIEWKVAEKQDTLRTARWSERHMQSRKTKTPCSIQKAIFKSRFQTKFANLEIDLHLDVSVCLIRQPVYIVFKLSCETWKPH